MAAERFRGRAGERAQLDRLLAQARSGHSAVLVVRGEAGIGKTALLRHATEQASAFQLAQITGVEWEMELAYAGLHQLCSPLVDQLADLPQPQQDAVNVALGQASGDPPDQFLVGLATLGLLSASGAQRPLFCVVDDFQWLDDASARVLAFVARRVLAEPLALVFAVREPNNRLRGLPRAGPARARRRRRPRVAGDRRPGSTRRAGTRPGRGRDARQPDSPCSRCRAV